MTANDNLNNSGNIVEVNELRATLVAATRMLHDIRGFL